MYRPMFHYYNNSFFDKNRVVLSWSFDSYDWPFDPYDWPFDLWPPLGERLSDAEVDSILKFTGTEEDLDGNIKYEGEYSLLFNNS